eukprot:6820571-Prymnesium_polylepis.1
MHVAQVGFLGECRKHTGVKGNDSDRATAQSQAFTAPAKSGGYGVPPRAPMEQVLACSSWPEKPASRPSQTLWAGYYIELCSIGSAAPYDCVDVSEPPAEGRPLLVVSAGARLLGRLTDVRCRSRSTRLMYGP